MSERGMRVRPWGREGEACGVYLVVEGPGSVDWEYVLSESITS